MTRRLQFLAGAIGALMLAGGTALAGGGAGQDDTDFCMDVETTEGFHMMPGFMVEPGACPVRDYWEGELQAAFYPFTREDHLFNCDYFGDAAPLPTGDMVPSWVVSNGEITGTIGGHPFSATLNCASLTNWYQDSCSDPADPSTCTFQLAQPFLAAEVPYFVRVTEVSVFDGAITIQKGKKKTVVPFVMATRAAGITHLESLDPVETQVGASITHSLLGLLTLEDDDVEVLDGSLDLLLQGHIFFPPDLVDPNPARVRGVLCSEELYSMLNKRGPKDKDKDDD